MVNLIKLQSIFLNSLKGPINLGPFRKVINMDETRQFDFLDVITIMALGIQMQEHILSENQPTNKQLMKKLDYIISILEGYAPNTSNEDTHP